jgi:hypothetical protein
VNLVPEPLEDVIVDPDGDPRLAGRSAQNGTTPPMPEVVLFLQSSTP